nr:MAG TPA: hypothetical protein [Caudoviricetes sp.]
MCKLRKRGLIISSSLLTLNPISWKLKKRKHLLL